MSLRHGILGLLAEGPASGYDLSRRFNDLLTHVWPAQHPNIYSELTRLNKEGLVEVQALGPRGRKDYAITDAGLAEIRSWLLNVPTDHQWRSEPVLRSFFFWVLEPDDLEKYLASEFHYYDETAKRYRSYVGKAERNEYGTHPRAKSLRTAIEAAARYHEAMAGWYSWAAQQAAD
ncbi:MAG: transcriptional regulator, PadR-like family [Glaciihabitans sp.]|nr:transcriptional regulator, PadR-like family [Glaciihabitans sp.]